MDLEILFVELQNFLVGGKNKMDFRGNPWILFEVIAGIMLLAIIIFGEPTEFHYSMLVGDIIALGFQIVEKYEIVSDRSRISTN